MKRFLILLALLLAGSVISARQYVKCYRYNVQYVDVAEKATADLEKLISQGFRIIYFSIDCRFGRMVVVYNDMKD